MSRKLSQGKAAAFAALSLCAGVHAQDAEREAPEKENRPFKLTAGWYDYSDGSRGYDVNLRNTSAVGNAWIALFRLPAQDVRQWRTGWDREFGEALRIKPSVQAASGGFVGGSVQAESGDPWFVAIGLGRTNLRPYYNLNFDPNDSYTVQVGYRESEQGRLVSAMMVRDNREHPDQRHFHLTYRQSLPAGRRMTLDALYKVGTVEDMGEKVRRWGFTASYDWPRLFAVVAYDPKTNFTPLNVWRFSIGTHF